MSFYNWDELPLTPARPGATHRRIFGDNIQMQHLIIEPGGQSGKLHNHPDHEEFFYVQEGEWEFTLEDETRPVGPGDVIHVKKGQMHHMRLLSDEEGGMVLEVFCPIHNPELAKDS